MTNKIIGPFGSSGTLVCVIGWLVGKVILLGGNGFTCVVSGFVHAKLPN